MLKSHSFFSKWLKNELDWTLLLVFTNDQKTRPLSLTLLAKLIILLVKLIQIGRNYKQETSLKQHKIILKLNKAVLTEVATAIRH